MSIRSEHPIYAFGDIHGQRAMLEEALALVEKDGGPQARVVFLGDYVDRGSDSKGVIDIFLNGRAEGRNWHFVKGNHDQVFQSFLEEGALFNPQTRSGLGWLHDRIGGTATLGSYLDLGELGREIPELRWLSVYGDEPMDDALLEELFDWVHEVVPVSHFEFLRNLPLYHEEPGFFFVHAGIRPGLPLHMQDDNDLMWIRDEFLNSQRNHGAFVVHGHTPVDAPDLRINRLNLDTGAGYGRPLSVAVFDRDGVFHLTAGGRQRL
ncbi:MAG: metallophosphoesterase [Pelagimonas sp.]|jgi:serine/threonine protein phosphatase 1|nr:metallophosphoesterase [Pelagimonas sp.]